MKKFITISMAFACLLAFAAPAFAETSIAVIDVKRLLGESKAGVSIQEQVKEEREKFLKELTKKEDKLREEEKELAAEMEKLSKEDFAKKRQEFEESFVKARAEAQKRKASLDGSLVKATNELKNKLYGIIGEIADDKGYTLVLSRQSVIIGDKSLDITDTVMEKLNKEVSKIALGK